MTTIDVTHDMNATSWVEGAQGSDFPIQNLPWGVCSTNGIVVAIGDKAVVLRKAINSEKLQLADEVSNALLQDSLNEFMSLGHEIWTLVRHSLFTFLSGEPCPEVLCA
jgi:fumarylacetoacetase